MNKPSKRTGWWRLAAAATGTRFFLQGCDPTIRGTVEDGIINLSSTFVGLLLRALIELGSEASA